MSKKAIHKAIHKAIQKAKELQEFCDSESCISCVFENKEGYCEIGYPTSWDLDELGDDEDV